MKISAAQKKIANIAKLIMRRHKGELDREKRRAQKRIKRPDFLWFSFIEAFAVQGGNTGWHILIGRNESAYNHLRFGSLKRLNSSARRRRVKTICHSKRIIEEDGRKFTAKVSYPKAKTDYILKSFNLMQDLGGPKKAMKEFSEIDGQEGKIKFLKRFCGIGDKSARNLMMNVYHPEFRDSIAVDERIKTISKKLGIPFEPWTFKEHEQFYLSAARIAGLSGWELDRLMWAHQDEFLEEL